MSHPATVARAAFGTVFVLSSLACMGGGPPLEEGTYELTTEIVSDGCEFGWEDGTVEVEVSWNEAETVLFIDDEPHDWDDDAQTFSWSSIETSEEDGCVITLSWVEEGVVLDRESYIVSGAFEMEFSGCAGIDDCKTTYEDSAIFID